MARIYFDSNIYSNLRRGENSKYIALEEAISKYKSNLVFVFSHAHIRDKINDNSDFKYLDFEYMKKWVGDNYLSYHLLEKKTSFYLANPLDVFQDNDALDNLNYVMDAVGPYKELRSFIETGLKDIPYYLGNEKYSVDELFKDGQIQDRFNDFIKASLYHQDKNKIPYYDHYTHSYAILDILGFSKDKLNKKNSFNNIFNDSLHSYYAQFCDFLVTEDTGLKQKSSILYTHFNASTQILTVDDFLLAVESIGRDTENGLLDFFNNLAIDITESPIVNTDREEKPSVFAILPQHKYFNFFDLLQVVKFSDEELYIFLSKWPPVNHLRGAIFRERQLVINKMLMLFGNDLYKGTAFDFEKEVDEMNRGVWKGRYWEIGETQINANVNENSKEFCVQIGPFTRWIYMARFRNEKTE